jgi:hypothetical protein
MQQTDTQGYAAAFTEWMRRYQEDPQAFAVEFASVAPGDYGEQAAAYFAKLLREAPSYLPIPPVKS